MTKTTETTAAPELQRLTPDRLRRIGIAAALSLLAAALVIQFALPLLPPLGEMEVSVEGFAQFIRDAGSWGVVGSMGLMILHSFVPFPAEFIAFANGLVYGVIRGTVITWTGAMIGAILAFGLARWLGRPFVRSVMPERRWRQVDRWTERQGWRAVFVSRFFPIISFNLINYAAGLTPIRWWTFLWATGLGILPVTLILVIVGSRMAVLDALDWVLVAPGGVFVLALFHFVYRYWQRRAGSQELEELGD